MKWMKKMRSRLHTLFPNSSVFVDISYAHYSPDAGGQPTNSYRFSVVPYYGLAILANNFDCRVDAEAWLHHMELLRRRFEL